MIQLREKVSILGSAAAIVVIYLPLHWGWFLLSDLGSIIAALLVAGSILGWGFKERIERWVDRPKKGANTNPTVDSNQERHREELDLLIQPLYLAFDKYPDNPRAMQEGKFGLPMKTSLLMHPGQKSVTYLHVEKADPVIDAMQRHGNLAQPELRTLISEYLEFREKQGEKAVPLHSDEFKKMEDAINQIASLTKARYNELMWGKKEN